MNREPSNLNQPEHRTAMVHAQIVLVLFAVSIQLFLLTVTVERFLAGDTSGVLSLFLASSIAFILSVEIWHAHT